MKVIILCLLYIYSAQIGTIIILESVLNHMSDKSEKTMPICFSQEQLKFIEDYAKPKVCSMPLKLLTIC